MEFVLSPLVFCVGTEALRRKVHDRNLLAKTPALVDLFLSCSPAEKRVWHNLLELLYKIAERSRSPHQRVRASPSPAQEGLASSKPMPM